MYALFSFVKCPWWLPLPVEGTARRRRSGARAKRGSALGVFERPCTSEMRRPSTDRLLRGLRKLSLLPASRPPRGYGRNVRSFSFASFLPILGVSFRENARFAFSLTHPAGGARKKHLLRQVLFSMKRTLRCMKNEAGLRPVKRAFGTRRS